MSKRDPRICLQQMLDHAREASSLFEGRTRADLDSDRLLNLSLVRLLEVVGEAAHRIPTEKRVDYPQIPWVEVIGLRHRLIHGYDRVDFDILWNILKDDLPALIENLESALQEEEQR